MDLVICKWVSRRPVTEGGGAVKCVGTAELHGFLNQNSYMCKQLYRPCSPRSLFHGSHPSATSYSNGLTGEKKKKTEGGEGGLWVEMSWLMGQWHAAAPGFMSQSKSEYWEHGHHVTPDILRIIWQCIMLEICHTKRWACPPLRLKLQPAVQWAATLSILCGRVSLKGRGGALTRSVHTYLFKVRKCQNKY